ncbi:hypothetical protein LINPERHAP1_LOCUS4241 [Linum perenne]
MAAAAGYRLTLPALLGITLTVLIITAPHQASAQTYCNADLSSLMSQCWKYVQKSGSKSPPSPGCCAALKPVDLSCACPYVSKSVEGYVSMDKVVYVARTCGMNLAAGTKCGSVILFLRPEDRSICEEKEWKN